MKLGFVGGGVVGKATAKAFMEWAEIRIHDQVAERATHTLREVLDCELVFVCLPTPQKAGSLECDLTILRAFFSASHAMGYDECHFVIRSTVPIGTTRKLKEDYGLKNICHSPEFLTARCALTDAQTPSRNIIGSVYEEGLLGETDARLRELYHKRFAGVPTICMTSNESEAVKLFLNGFFAVKVAYFNEIRDLADATGLDWNLVMAGVMSDGRIAHSHTQVPGHDGKFGFGGTCLPKDLANLISCIRDCQTDDGGIIVGPRPYVTSAALARNLKDRERK